MAWLSHCILWMASRANDAVALGLARSIGALLRLLNVDAVCTTRTNLATCLPDLTPARLDMLVRDSVSNMVPKR